MSDVLALVAGETVVLALLVVLVAGLLRSHAEILRRLGPPAQDDPAASATLPRPPASSTREAPDIVGATLDGEAVKIAVGAAAPPTLIAFLTSGCGVCRGFWDGLKFGQPPALGASPPRLLVVAKDGSHESPSRLAELESPDVPVIMSSAAWRGYGVPGSPYFVFVKDGAVHGEGSATNWEQIASLLRDARHDERLEDRGARHGRIDDVLRAAGIGPDHPSLYPGAGGESESAAG